MSASIDDIRNQIQHSTAYNDTTAELYNICLALLDVVADLNYARDVTNGTIGVHTDHLNMCSRDIVSLTHKVNDLVGDADLYAVDTRDYFAAATLTGLLAHRGVVSPAHSTGEVADLVEDAYHVADAMLAARGVKPAFHPQKSQPCQLSRMQMRLLRKLRNSPKGESRCQHH